MNKIIFAGLFILVSSTVLAQEVKSWTEEDRKYLLENLIRSRDELIKETKGLSKKQWTFKESPDRWSINEIVEHIGYWELLIDYQISNAMGGGKQPDKMKTVQADSVSLNFIMEEKLHYSLDYTKPYSYTIPMGTNTLDNNIAWLMKMRNESIEFIKTTQEDMRAYFYGQRNVHLRMITLFGHMDRHLRQIRKVKKDPKYPK